MTAKLAPFVITLLLLAAAVCGAWADGTPGDVSWGVGLFSDHVARNLGDIVTVLVMESASSTGEVSSGAKREEDINGGPGTGKLDVFPEFGVKTKNQQTGQATMNRKGRLVAKVPARVVEILPDGTLRLEGSREVTSNGEHELLHLTGLVRPIDIAADNSVVSSLMADARIQYNGKGTLTNGQRMSRLMRLINWIF
jgi:flagellar L-ring protein precursor FlgH